MDILRHMNWVDVLAVIIIIRISYIAFQDGLSHEIFPVITVVARIVICLNYYNKIGRYISENLLKMPLPVANFLSFLVLAVGTGLIFKLVRMLLDKIIKVEWHPLIERFGGLLFGMVRAFLVTSLVMMTITLAPFKYLQWSVRDKSVTGMYILRIGPSIYEKISGVLPAAKEGSPALSKENIINELVSDKTITPEVKKKEKKADWEKI